MSPTSVPVVSRLGSFLVIAVAIAWGAWIQNAVLLGSDVGWLIRSVRLMAEGQRFGVDIFEANLPVTWYLCMPAAWAIDALELTEVTAIRLWIWIVAGVSLLLVRSCLLRAGDCGHRTWVELAAAAIAACVLVGPSFGQREHLALLLSLPYLFVIRLRSSDAPISSAHAISAGLLAGVAFSIKPIFLAVPLAVEVALLALRRQHWSGFRPETLSMVIAGLFSAGGALALAPDYLSRVVPATYATYWAYDSPAGMLFDSYPVAPAVFVGWLAALLADRRIAHASVVWFAAFAAWSASYFIQHRGFDYHGYPVLACAFVISAGALAILAVRLREAVAVGSGATPARWKRMTVIGGTLSVLAILFTFASDTRLWYRGTQEDWPGTRMVIRKELLAYLETLDIGPGTKVFAFSSNPSPLFPTLNYLGAEWVAPEVAQFLLPAWIRRDEARDDAHRAAIDAAMAIQREHVHRALVAGNPDVILVNRWSRGASPRGEGRKRLDFFAIFGTDPAVAAALGRYEKITELRGAEVYLRRTRPLAYPDVGAMTP